MDLWLQTNQCVAHYSIAGHQKLLYMVVQEASKSEHSKEWPDFTVGEGQLPKGWPKCMGKLEESTRRAGKWSLAGRRTPVEQHRENHLSLTLTK